MASALLTITDEVYSADNGKIREGENVITSKQSQINASAKTDKRDSSVFDNDVIPTPTVGEIIKDEFLQPLGITPYRLSKELGVSTSSVLDIIHGRRKVSVEMALRLSKFFGNSHMFWLNLQNEIEVRDAKIRIGKELDQIHLFKTA